MVGNSYTQQLKIFSTYISTDVLSRYIGNI